MCFFFLSFHLFSFFLFILDFFLSKNVHCEHSYPTSTKDASSVVGAPWRCDIMTTVGIAGVGWGPLPGREHDSTPRSGVEAPRGASASSRKKTERPWIGLLLFETQVQDVRVCMTT